MKTISSRWTFARKRVFPALWFALVVGFIVHSLWTRIDRARRAFAA